MTSSIDSVAGEGPSSPPAPVTSSVIGPLNFGKDDSDIEAPPTRLTDESAVPCMFCENIYDFRENGIRDQYLAHLYLVHRLVVADVTEIDCLASYAKFWKEKFLQDPVEKYCAAMLLNQLPDGTPASNEKYFLLSDIEPTDYELRLRLKREMMELVLTRHQFERTDRNFNRGCLYCRDFRSESRVEFIEHLYKKHFLLLGKAENLVFVDELIDTVQQKMDQLVCLYCEKIFKDRPTLKEHMRKKGHKRINPENKIYDRFFLVNYRNDRFKKPASTTKQPVSINVRPQEKSPFHSEDSDSDWSDWYGEDQKTTCLFCPNAKEKIEDLKAHMIAEHSFDFDAQVIGLSFYQRVKVVNFIRRQMHVMKCVMCREDFSSRENLENHLKEQNHYGIGDQQLWDQPEFFFPTYEDDQFLCHLEDDSPDQSDDSSVVISEKVSANISAEAESLSLEQFKFV
ncbi:zinc finger protein 277 [Uranotaenia lowii]|uniref:zinc finger protein 277 n=1 Tax=Uranotaenia lowii TaxID=190385 RepID=UPI00247A1610|nr:zinc finger protein 277 [Uranotaenia lowii]